MISKADLFARLAEDAAGVVVANRRLAGLQAGR
jgi:hypothetical protein